MELNNFYQGQSTRKPLVTYLLPAIPLLHFVRQESEPYKDVICNKPEFGNWKWWGLEKLDYKQIRRNITERFALPFVCYYH